MRKTTPFLYLFVLGLVCSLFYQCSDSPATTNLPGDTGFFSSYGSPDLDGSGSDEAWESANWYPIATVVSGTAPDSNDFRGRFRSLWDENMLYILVEIKDDTLVDTNPDGLKRYTDDDCLLLILDEDGSGGNHTYNYNAFAYHIALDGKVVDVAPDSSIRYYDDHCVLKRSTKGDMSIWEIGLKVFDGNTYVDEGENIAKSLKAGKKLGFAVGYYDNDHSQEREHLSVSLQPQTNTTVNPEQDASCLKVLELKQQE